MYCLYNIKPAAMLSVLQCKTKGRFRRLLASEGARLRKSQPQRLAALAADFSNLRQVAVQLGYPVKLLVAEPTVGIAGAQAPLGPAIGGAGAVTKLEGPKDKPEDEDDEEEDEDGAASHARLMLEDEPSAVLDLEAQLKAQQDQHQAIVSKLTGRARRPRKHSTKPIELKFRKYGSGSKYVVGQVW